VWVPQETARSLTFHCKGNGAGAVNQEAGRKARLPFCAVRFLCYFRSSSWPVHEPTTRLILPRSTAPLLEVAKLPSTCFSI
jgi:hypothetical protein